MRRLSILILLLCCQACTITSVSTAFDDSRNEALSKQRIADVSPLLAASNVNVTSYRGIVLITGQVPSAELIPRATAAVEPLRNVRRVHNELTVAGETTLLSKTNDSWLTTKLKTALSTNEATDATRVKVVTENEVVYLMGLVTRAEADAVVEVSRQIQGVQKIVKVFEYIN